ncbi:MULTISPECIES: alpha/beta fold hydrolase [Microbacterium]|uniref:alpha/beta fold hydrolase n=1 Tax=Microbacterium TaxID=33882 RepID=UPI00146B1792|nr:MULTISPECIES: alpha/beta fold hydrolase [Microbacterium]
MIPVVLLPGMNCSADLWSECVAGDVLYPELTSTSIDGQVDSLLDRLPERFVLGGLSLGGIVAMALAARAPDRVRGLVLAATNAKAPTDLQRRGWADWIRRLDAGETARDLQRSILPALLMPTSGETRPDLLERTLAMGDATGEATLRNQLVMQGTRIDLRSRLGRICSPTLVVSGLRDPICPPSFHAELVEAIPDAKLMTLDTSHLVPMEQPAAFGRLLRTWLRHLEI